MVLSIFFFSFLFILFLLLIAILVLKVPYETHLYMNKWVSKNYNVKISENKIDFQTFKEMMFVAFPENNKTSDNFPNSIFAYTKDGLILHQVHASIVVFNGIAYNFKNFKEFNKLKKYMKNISKK